MSYSPNVLVREWKNYIFHLLESCKDSWLISHTQIFSLIAVHAASLLPSSRMPDLKSSHSSHCSTLGGDVQFKGHGFRVLHGGAHILKNHKFLLSKCGALGRGSFTWQHEPDYYKVPWQSAWVNHQAQSLRNFPRCGTREGDTGLFDFIHE